MKDKKAARTLLTGGATRRKRREKPVHEKTWFRAVALLAGLLVVAGLLAWVLWPKSADQLFAEAQALMAAGDADSRTKAREGPLQKYLERFSERQDEQAQQMNRWADQVDLEHLQLAWVKRRGSSVGGLSFPPQERAEELYRHGVKAEEDGDLAQAVKHWAALEQVEADTPRETRIRHEFGMARRKVVTDALALEDELTKLGPRDKPRSEQERLALLALRYERFKDTPLAHEHWLEVRRTASHRGWSLLASKRVREVQPLPPDPGGRRLELVQQSFKSAQESVEKDPAQAQALCEEIRALYTQDANPAVREVAKKAEALLAQLRPK